MLARRITLLDLYCGLGGLSLGFEMTGAFDVVGGIDNYKWAIKTFYQSHKANPRLISQPQDLSTLSPESVMEDLGKAPEIIVGGPPCQGFSHAGKRLSDLQSDPRNMQVFHFLRFVRAIKPRVFLMENVSGIALTGQEKRDHLLELLRDEYRGIGYSITWAILNTVDYRVPQKRKRLIMVGALNTEQLFKFPEPPCGGGRTLFSETEDFYTVGDAMDDLPTTKLEEPQDYERPPRTSLQQFLRRDSDKLYNHLVTKHDSKTLDKICEQKVGTRLYPTWNHSWFRLDQSCPAPAVKENHRAPFIHFSEHRAVSPRECARLQTIPDRVILAGKKSAQLIQVGNAVPPVFAAHLATEISKQFFDYPVPVPWDKSNNPLLGDSAATWDNCNGPHSSIG